MVCAYRSLLVLLAKPFKLMKSKWNDGSFHTEHVHRAVESTYRKTLVSSFHFSGTSFILDCSVEFDWWLFSCVALLVSLAYRGAFSPFVLRTDCTVRFTIVSWEVDRDVVPSESTKRSELADRLIHRIGYLGRLELELLSTADTSVWFFRDFFVLTPLPLSASPSEFGTVNNCLLVRRPQRKFLIRFCHLVSRCLNSIRAL